MTQEHPITPPPNLVQEWYHEADNQLSPYYVYMAHQAARWGADQQLEQCVAWLDGYEHEGWAAEQMRNACRPKPPSLKQQALAELDLLRADATVYGLGFDAPTIRRALESLPD